MIRRIGFAATLLCGFALAATAQVKLPPYSRTALANGIPVYVVERQGLPLVSLEVVVRGGDEADPAGAGPLCDITAELLRRGTQRRTAAQFSEELDGLGATFNASCDEQSTAVRMDVLAKDFAAGLDLLTDATLNPAFGAEEVTKATARRVDELNSIKDNPGFAINYYSRAFFFGPEHPYGRVPDEQQLRHITPEALRGYHNRLYVASNLSVIVAGSVDRDAVEKQIDAAFRGVSTGTQYEWKAVEPVKASARLLLVDVPGATQTYFHIMQPGVTRTTRDRVPLMLVETLFGGRFTSMLNDALRVTSGLTYGASNRLEEDRLVGMNSIQSYTKTATTVEAIDLALEVLKKLHENGITAEQLASAKAYVKGTFPPRHLETQQQLGEVLREFEIYGLHRGEIDDLFSAIDAVTLERANQVAAQYFQTGPLTFVLLGDAAKIREAVKKYAPQMLEIPVSKPGFTAP